MLDEASELFIHKGEIIPVNAFEREIYLCSEITLKLLNKGYDGPVVLKVLDAFKNEIDGCFCLVNVDLNYIKVYQSVIFVVFYIE